MADRRPAEGRLPRFDRVSKPTARPAHDRDQQGKEALYSTAPGAAASSQVLVVCTRCDIESGVSVLELVRLARPPMFWNPVNGRLYARCPACGRRSWLRVRKGQVLRALLDRQVDR